MDAIAVDGLRKAYGDVQALDGVSFSVEEGEIYGLLGPNGAGKTTTVRVLVTLTKPDDGRAVVSGHDVARDPGGVRRSIGYVPQESGVDRYGTGRARTSPCRAASRASAARSCAGASTSCSSSSASPTTPTASCSATRAA